ncbi:hypothetical protein JCM30237_30620 [Halolamina litorea]|uniref:Uncharacterized protein n=1 Tax=Halolamina litorea TaxID=1515593 RepID=A0ABD6BPB5_9EURY|nr:hypothetical protein [Halolamina litorea]
MTVRVFELRGVYVFEYDGEVPPSIEGAYNEFEGRYELASKTELDGLPESYELVEDPDPYRVEFRGDPPDSVTAAALFVEDGPMSTTVLCPDEDSVERAIDAGGRRVD